MSFEIALLGTALYVLFWEKMPEWRIWSEGIFPRLPRSVQWLYGEWRCAFCSGFWIALVLHGVTGFWTIAGLAELPDNLGYLVGVPAAWFLDGLAGGTLIFTASLGLKAIKLPVIQAELAKQQSLQEPS